MIGSNAPCAVLFASLVAVFSGVLGGCGSAPPTVGVASASITQQTDEGSLVEFEFLAANPGADPLPLREITYSLEANGRRVFEGTRSPQVTIPAGGEIRFMLPVSLPIGLGADPGAGPIGYLLQGVVHYVAPGPFADAMYDSGLNRPSIAFSDAGTLRLHEEQQAEEQQGAHQIDESTDPPR